MRLHEAGSIAEIHPDQGVSEGIGPPTVAMGVNHLELGSDPVGFGIHQGAIHVPQDGRKRKCHRFAFEVKAEGQRPKASSPGSNLPIQGRSGKGGVCADVLASHDPTQTATIHTKSESAPYPMAHVP